MIPALRFGFSPCPNDTFAFWAAVHGVVDQPLPLEPVIEDIEALNERAVLAEAGQLEVTKLSLPALARCADRYAVLRTGAALGFGCGPLVVCRDDANLQRVEQLATLRVAIPGRHTTAFLLLKSLLREPFEPVAMRFDQVMPAVASGDCAAGLIIHESRFTYARHGLRELVDLGSWWERESGGPLPLGVIAARRSLPRETFEAIERMLGDSVRLARRDPLRPRAWIREHAQELAEDVQQRHIELYVNDFSEDLGEVGARAIDELLRCGREVGLLPDGASPWPERAR